MAFFPQRTLFITWQALIPQNAESPEWLLAPGVIPALLSLKNAGFKLVLLAGQDDPHLRAPDDRWVRFLASQGVTWDHILTLSHTPVYDSEMSRSGEYFAAIREDIWAQKLDRKGTAVIGVEGDGSQLADLLGVRFFAVDVTRPWLGLAQSLLQEKRQGSVFRRTQETDIHVALVVDGDPEGTRIQTGIGYFDHMLHQLARHGGLELVVQVQGDLHIDDHHTVEDTGLALGEALRQALGDRRGIARYGFTVPMDETLATCALDLSGRPAFVFKGTFSREKVGELATEMVPHFFQSVSQALGAAIHLSFEGVNAHHQVEGIFKAFAKSLAVAMAETGRKDVPSTKGVL